MTVDRVNIELNSIQFDRQLGREMSETQPYPHLFSPGRIGSVTIPNRVVQLPMGSGLLVQGRMTEGDIRFMEERARGGVGLIITGAGAIHETALWSVRIKVEAWDRSRPCSDTAPRSSVNSSTSDARRPGA